MTAELLLVRHGRTAMNASGALQGRIDIPLDDVGVAQAVALGHQLATSGASRVVSSPLQRARRTAELVAEPLGLAVDIDDRLVEIDYGTWDTRPLRDIDPADWAAWRADPDFAPPGGESLVAVTARATDFAAAALGIDATTIAVSHVSPIKAIVAWALGAGVAATWRMHLGVAAICCVAGTPAAPVLRAFGVDAS